MSETEEPFEEEREEDGEESGFVSKEAEVDPCRETTGDSFRCLLDPSFDRCGVVEWRSKEEFEDSGED